ncbi:phage protein Gp36 family protein [Rufibacter quisquiliarum]|uniref:Phage gp36-like protein n=1 Tax=Rufibacter quisquiliarum TaxID=1549639 RepID=A0A839GM70_9BACT|nr:phage protein Gp36 family protein [Rufibacter quisquiliarum]MBA9078953.1 phage gp36-like protein [Rufibacter quisquiliarum]
MAFLTDEDYKGLIDQEDLEAFSENDPETRRKAERQAQEDISSYLRSRFDVAAIFATEGESRNSKIVEVMADLSIWNLIPSGTYRDVSDIRETRYKAAITWLCRVQKGELLPELPRYQEESGKGRTFRWGSQSLREQL